MPHSDPPVFKSFRGLQKMSSILIAVFALCLLGVRADSTPFTSCSTVADPIDLRFDGCTESPCPIYTGETATAEWDFEITTDTKTLTPRARATVYGFTITYPLSDTNGCGSLTNAECPLDKGEEITYALNFPISSAYPAIPLDIEFSLLDDNGDAQVCFKISAKVQARS